jgi:transposase
MKDLRDLREQILDWAEKGGKRKVVAHMARKGNPISVRKDRNRSSDSSRFSEGDRESHRMLQSPVFPYSKKAWEDVADVQGGHDFF